MMKNSKVVYYLSLPTKKQFLKDLGLLDDTQIIILYDKKLNKIPIFLNWKNKFKYSQPLIAGEKLKSITSYAEHVEQILKKCPDIQSDKFTIVSIGGGSVGDFCGFVASTLKRGVRLIHMPTTWLSAIDSAHGGKTALNVNGFKNQLGTFYPSTKTFIVKSLLNKQPASLENEAYGELFKMSLIQGGQVYQNLKQVKKITLWPLLQPVIKGKMDIVRKDPFEKIGLRQILNLGHTIGHVIEAEFGKPHGTSVLLGTIFSLRWSYHKNYLSEKHLVEIERIYFKFMLKKDVNFLLNLKFNKNKFLNLLLKDKKKSSNETLNFIFVQGPGIVMSFSFLGQIPASKSLMNRALILKSFYPDFDVIGESKADDVALMEEGIRRLKNAYEIQCGHAGTVLRFLALRCSREVGQHILVGEKRLFERPQEDLFKIFRQLSVKAEIKSLTDKKSALVISSEGWKLQGNTLHVSLQKSSQFASAVLLSCWDLPQQLYLRFDIKNKENILSNSYLDMTKSFLTSMGMFIKGSGDELSIGAQQRPKRQSYHVEPDMSTAAAVAALGVVGGNAKILNFPVDSLQPDYIFPTFLAEMGVDIDFKSREKISRLCVAKPKLGLKSIRLNLKDNPDLFPVMAVLCALAKGESSLRGAAQLNHKESNRITKVSELLRKIKRPHKTYEDGIEIFGVLASEKESFQYETDQDHRLAMAAGILKLAGYDIEVINPEVVNKSFPEFWSLLQVT
jgi:3-phosphoshikimate 1-carboxyvinyltransferase